MTARDEIIIQQLKNLITLVSNQPCEPISKTVSHDIEHIEMLTIQECAAEFKGLTQNTIRQLIRKGKIKYIRTGEGRNGKILVNKTSLAEYLSNNL